jgi:hypothetical protein
MTELEKIGYLASLDRVQAQDRINQGLIDWDSPEGVKELFLLAYGDEEKAKRAWRKAQDYYVEKKMQEARAARR